MFMPKKCLCLKKVSGWGKTKARGIVTLPKNLMNNFQNSLDFTIDEENIVVFQSSMLNYDNFSHMYRKPANGN